MASNPPSHPGLTTAEVAERRRRGETNAFRARVGRTYWHIVRDNVLNLFNLVLFALMVVVLLFRDYSTILFAGFSVVTNSILGMLQEISAKRKLDQLAALAAQDVSVWRDGKLISLPARALVKDDVLPIQPGDRLPVDGRVLVSDGLEMDESQLTGESDAVFKEEGSEVCSGSFCIAGTGLMVATRVGKDSTINQLSTLAKVYKNIQTPTQQRISALVEITLLAMLIIGPMLFVASWQNGESLLQIVRNEVVFVTSIVPQGLVLVAILSLTLGAISISRHQTLVQKVNAVESMANVSVLCFDKTGTLTRNQLAVTEIIPLNGAVPGETYHRLHTYTGSLAHRNRTATAVADYVSAHLPSANGQKPAAKRREIPFNSSRKWGAVVFDDETLIMGAPERVLHPSANPLALEQAQALAAQGLRVLAFARSEEPLADGVITQASDPLALIVLSDQVRPEIQETLQAFRDLNVELKVISGDNLDTVKSIATQAGMDIHNAYTGDQLEQLTEAELEAAVTTGNLFARIEPHTKQKIIAALKRQGAYVAMVGDGVNDVPALKEAHLAIAMNDGAQISKDVADIVLLNNAMTTLPLAFREGTRITQVIFGTTKLFLTKNFYNILMIFFVGFMTLPFPTSPVQISWITFGTVNIPATLIAFQLLRPAFMKEFRRDVLDYVITAGGIGAVNLALLFAAVYFVDNNVYEARSAVTLFIALFGILIFWHTHDIDLFYPPSWFKHWGITLLGLVLAALTMLVPFAVPHLFDFVPPTPLIWALIIAVFFLTAALLALGRRYRRLLHQLWLLLRP